MAAVLSPKHSSERSMRLYGKVATMPAKFGKRYGSDMSKKSREDPALPAEQLIDLKFLTKQERLVIERVIQKDLRLRRAILGSLKQSIEDGQQFEEEHKSRESGDQPFSCDYCEQPIRTICTRVLGIKCSNCGNVICKRCSGKQLHGPSTLCLTCSKQRLLKLQTLDYESLLHYGQPGIASGVQEKKTSQFAESELIKKSLEGSRTSSSPSKTVRISTESDEDIKQKNRSSSLVPVDEGKKNSRSSSLVPSGQADTFKPIRRSRSDTFSKYKDTARVHSIDDADCGFKLISKTSDESLVDLCSVYSEPCYPDVKITGRILIGVWYRKEEKRLYVRCMKAENLAAPVDGALDPYVKTYLLPGLFKSNKRKTGLQYETTKPVWDEILKYADLTQEDVCSRTLLVSVWDWNRYGRQQFLGEVQLPLSTCDLTNPKDQWYTLQDSAKRISPTEEVDSLDSKGRVLLGLKFEPYSPDTLRRKRFAEDESKLMGCLHILIKQAEDLPAMEVNNRTDAFARCYILPNQFLGGKKKSKIVEDSLNPVWEEELVYSYLSLEELHSDRALEVTIWDHDRRGSNQFIGGIRIGPNPLDIINPYDWMDSMESESSHWEAMLSKPGQWVEAWHILRPSMDSLHQEKKRLGSSLSSVSLPNETSADGVDTPNVSSPASAAIKDSAKLPSEDKSLAVNIRRPVKGNYKISGELLTGIKHSNGYLFVTISKAQGLTGVNKDGTSNPFVKTYLLPDRSKASKMKTAVKKKTVAPVYNQTFKYKVPKRDLHNRTLWVTVWSWDRLGANSFIGETCIALGGAHLRYTSERWYELHDFTETGVIMATPVGHTPLPKSRRRKHTSSQAPPLEQAPPVKQAPPLEQAPKDNEEESKPGTPLLITQAEEEKDNPNTMRIPVVTVEDFDIN